MAAVVALLDVTAEVCRPAGEDVAEHATMRGWNVSVAGTEVVRPVFADDVRDLERRPSQDGRGSGGLLRRRKVDRALRAWSVLSATWR